MKKNECYDEGFESGLWGFDPINPYPLKSTKYQQWETGYWDGMNERIDDIIHRNNHPSDEYEWDEP